MRNNAWLENRLQSIWQTYFADVPEQNKVRILFGRRARTRLGSIKLVRSMEQGAGRFFLTTPNSSLPTPYSLIIINGFFKEESIPEYVIDLTIAHELAHYAHGFSSTLPQLYDFPHQGRLVDKELIKRGMGDMLLLQRKWLKEEWPEVLKAQGLMRKARRRRVGLRTVIKFLISN